jgi:hypothetical protein
VGAILIKGPNRRTHFWKRTIQWLFHQNFILIEQMVSDKKICMGISNRVLCNGGHLGYRTALTDTILKGDHPRIISAKFGWDWLSSFRGEDFFLISSPFLAQWFLRRRFLCEFPKGSYVKLSSAVGAILIEGPNRRTHFWKRTIQWLFHQNFILIEQMVSDKKIFMGISHRSYVKLSSAVAAILVCVLKCRTQFWKRTTQESFQQSLVEIGSVVSEEKLFFKFHPPFF